MIEHLIYGTKNGDEEWQEQILLSGEKAEKLDYEKLKTFFISEGFYNIRKAEINLAQKPDFTKTIN